MREKVFFSFIEIIGEGDTRVKKLNYQREKKERKKKEKRKKNRRRREREREKK